MPKTRLRVERELIPHLWVMGAALACTVVLTFWPQDVTGAGYRCVLDSLFGIRCPFCGMTRDFAAILHGTRPVLNPCSWLAAIVVYVVYPAAVLAAWHTRRLDWFYSRALGCAVMVALVVMTVLNNLR